MEIAKGVYGAALDANFVVQVGSRAITRNSYCSDNLSRSDFIPGLDYAPLEVAIGGRKAVAVIETDHEPIIPFASDEANHPVCGGHDRRSGRDRNVQSLVKSRSP